MFIACRRQLCKSEWFTLLVRCQSAIVPLWTQSGMKTAAMAIQFALRRLPTSLPEGMILYVAFVDTINWSMPRDDSRF
jgi:hypothetical protein